MIPDWRLAGLIAIGYFIVIPLAAIGWRLRHPKPQARQASPSSAPEPAPVPGTPDRPPTTPAGDGGQSPAPAERQP